MKFLSILSALITIAVYLAITAPPEMTPAMQIQCPLEVTLGIQNVPENWNPFVAPGLENQSFQSVYVSNEDGKSVIGCYYLNPKSAKSGDLEFAPYHLSRTLTGNYNCKADGKFGRTVNCIPKINVKKN